MFFITLLGLLLRLTFIDKPEGLWNDEYVSWMVANTPLFHGFWNALLKQCHMPLYYLFLKPFTYFSDNIMRLSSVFYGVLSIPVMYLTGKEYSKKIGIFAGTITSILSFLIYYSQEVRFYSLLFLFSALLLLFVIKYLKNSSKFNLIGFIITSLLIIFTHDLGIIYVFFMYLFVFCKKKFFKTLSNRQLIVIFCSILLVLVAVFILGINILRQMPSSQWWGHFSYTNLLFLFSDFLSPILTNHVNAPPRFLYSSSLVLWLTVPTILGIIGMCFGIKQNKEIILASVCSTIFISVLAYFGIIVFISKYLIEVLSIFIILMSCGFARLNRVGLVLFILFVSFHIANIYTENYVTKLPRNEGHRIVGEVLNARQPEKIIFTYYEPDRFYRYLNYKDADMFYISKINRFDYVDKPQRILDNIKSGDKFSVVFLDSVSFVPEKYIKNSDIPEMFITFSHIKNTLLKAIQQESTILNIDTLGSWTVITSVKK